MSVLEAITLRGMRFHTRVGVLPHEKIVPQPLEVDLTVWLRGDAIAPDAAPAVDYQTLYTMVAEHVTAAPIGYLEGFCREIARRVIAESRAVRVLVAARKLHPPIGGPVEHAEVTIDVSRDA